MPDEVYLAPSCHGARCKISLQGLMPSSTSSTSSGRNIMPAIWCSWHRSTRSRLTTLGTLPERALSWYTTAFKDLPGCWIVLHQCMFGCAYLDQDGFWKLVKKPTGILSSKVSMQAALSKQCDGQRTYCSPEGSAPGLGRRASYLEDYQPGLGAAIAAAICAPDPAQLWDYGLAVSEQKEATGCLVKLQTTLKSEVVRSV